MVLRVIPTPESGSGLKNANPGLQPGPRNQPHLQSCPSSSSYLDAHRRVRTTALMVSLQEKGDDALWKTLWASCRKSRRGRGKLPSSSRCFCPSRDAEPLFQEHGKGGVSSALTTCSAQELNAGRSLSLRHGRRRVRAGSLLIWPQRSGLGS